MAFPIDSPLPLFYDRNGDVLDAGYVYIGTVNLNPITNPIPIFWDAALTIPAPQPLRTVRGYIARNGSPAQVYVNSAYSLLVRDSDSQLLLNAPNPTSEFLQLGNPDGATLIGYQLAALAQIKVRTVAQKLSDFINVNDFVGVDPTGVSDSTVGIQAAEDYCAALGRPVELWWAGTYVTSASINKKANVHWRGQWTLKPINQVTPTACFATVLANTVNNWSIDGGTFENIPYDVYNALLPTRSFNPGQEATCIDAYHCEQYVISNCTIRKYRQGILYRGGKHCKILNNSFFAANGKTLASMLDYTFTQFSTFPSICGGIIGAYLASGPDPDFPEDYLIQGNYVDNVGLDVGIDGLSQTYDRWPGLITNNVIVGGNCGIQNYRGSFTPGGAQVYRTDTHIADNYVYASWEQGIYLRGLTGISVKDNIVIRSPLNVGGASGTSNGGIVTRVNPAVSLAGATVDSTFPPCVIEGNYVIEPGRDNATLDGGIMLRVSNCIVRNNVVIRQANTFPTSLGPAILIDRGETPNKLIVEGNYVYNFAQGVQWDATARDQIASSGMFIRDNVASFCGIGYNIATLWHRGLIFENNSAQSCTTGLALSNSPYSTLKGNKFVDCTTGISLGSGNLASDYIARKYAASAPANAISAGGRIGATLKVLGNEFVNVTTPHTVSGTASGDDNFQGRCAQWEGDLIDGRVVRSMDYASAAPPTSRPKQWDRGDIVYNTTIAAATVYARICSVAGQHKANAATITTTGDTTTGNRTVINVGAVGGIGPGQYLSVGVDTLRVQEVTFSPNTIVFETAPTATAVGAAIAAAADPTFINLYTTGAA